MRVAVVWLHRCNRRLGSRKPACAKLIEDPRLQLAFGQGMTPAYLSRWALKRSERDALRELSRLQWRFEPLGRPGRLEFLHQVCGGDHGLLQFANQLDRPGVYQSDVWNFVIRRVLHGNFAAAGKKFSQLTVKLFPTGIHLLAPGK